MNSVAILSREDHRKMSELSRDKRSAYRGKREALTFYHNLLNDLHKTEEMLWEHFEDAYNLDRTAEHRCVYDRLERRYVISKLEEDDE